MHTTDVSVRVRLAFVMLWLLSRWLQHLQDCEEGRAHLGRVAGFSEEVVLQGGGDVDPT